MGNAKRRDTQARRESAGAEAELISAKVIKASFKKGPPKSEAFRGKDQANKSIGWMPWRQEPKKDVVSCEKPWEAASKL